MAALEGRLTSTSAGASPSPYSFLKSIMARVVLAMSGGVDSSVAASLLLEQRHEVIGVFMRHGEEAVNACTSPNGDSPLLPLIDGRPDHKQGCCSASDAQDARRVADMLDIPFYALNLQAEFGRIIDYFVDEYTARAYPKPLCCLQHMAEVRQAV